MGEEVAEGDAGWVNGLADAVRRGGQAQFAVRVMTPIQRARGQGSKLRYNANSGSSSPTLPALTKDRKAVAVNSLVTEARSKRVALVTG